MVPLSGSLTSSIRLIVIHLSSPNVNRVTLEAFIIVLLARIPPTLVRPVLPLPRQQEVPSAVELLASPAKPPGRLLPVPEDMSALAAVAAN